MTKLSSPGRASHWLLARIAVAMLLAVALPIGARGQGGPPAPMVTVAPPIAKRIVRWDEYTGRFEAVQRVEVRPRVSGYIGQIHFADGSVVAKGDLLFTIDPRPYEIAVELAHADVERAKAQVLQGVTDYARATELVKTSATTVRDLDQRRATLDVARAQQKSAEAAQRNAELNLEWTRVVAPVAGRISDRKVDVGNLVTGTGEATLLTTIVSMDPIHFVFNGSETDYIRYTRLNSEGQRQSSRDAGNPVQLRLTDETEWTHTGRMNFVDNEVNARSGTIRGRAVFDNKDFFFTPGTFGRLRLFGGFTDVLLVPDGAIVSDQARKILFVLGGENKVEARPVTLAGIAFGLRAITGGLKPDDKVIIGGLANPFVRAGVVVQPQAGEIKLIETASAEARPPGAAEVNAAPKPADKPAAN